MHEKALPETVFPSPRARPGGMFAVRHHGHSGPWLAAVLCLILLGLFRVEAQTLKGVDFGTLSADGGRVSRQASFDPLGRAVSVRDVRIQGGSGPGVFTVGYGDCGAGSANGARCGLVVGYQPRDSGGAPVRDSATLTLDYCTLGGGFCDTLSARVVADVMPALSSTAPILTRQETISPRSNISPADIGQVPIGSTGFGTLLVTNLFDTAISITPINVAGDTEVISVTQGDCPNILEPGGFCDLQASCTPTAESFYSASVLIADASGSVFCEGILLSGLTLTLSPDSATLPPDATFQVTNLTQTDISFQEISLVQGNSFSINGDTCQQFVPQGSSCEISVTFTGSVPDTDFLSVSYFDPQLQSGISSLSASLTGQPAFPTVTVATSADGAETDQVPVVFTISLDEPAGPSGLGVLYTLNGSATPGEDYQTPAETVAVIAPGETGTSVSLTPLDDALVEGDETVVLSLSTGPDYVLGESSEASGLIRDNDAPPVTLPTVTLAVPTPAVREDSGDQGLFIIGLDQPAPDGGLSIAFQIGGDATADEDYRPLPATVRLFPGQREVRLPVVPIPDGLIESDETVTLSLLRNPGYNLGPDRTGSVTILDDDDPDDPDNPAPLASLVASDPLAAEPDDPATLILSLNPAPVAPLTVNYRVDGSAVPGEDYTALPGSVTVAPGQASVALLIEPVDDTLVEDRETVVITLLDGSGYRPGDPVQAEVALDSDDQVVPIVTVLASDPEADEGGDPGVFRVDLDRPPGIPLGVAFELAGSATAGEDFEALPDTLTFLPDQTSQELVVSVIDDDLPEPAETVVLRLAQAGDGQRYVVGTPAEATVTIGIDREEAIDTLTEFATTPDQRSIATAVASLCADGVGSAQFQADCQPLIDAALAGNPETGQVLAAITPDSFVSAADVSLNGLQAQLANVRSRLLLLRRGAAGMDMDNLVFQTDEVAVSGEQLRSLLRDGTGGAASDDEGIVNLGRLGIFVSGQVSVGERDDTDSQRGFDFQTGGLTLGADYRLQPGLVLGGALTYLDADSDFNSDRGDLQMSGWGVNAYGIYYVTEDSYLDGTVGYSWYDYDQRRNVRYSLNGQRVDQRFDADYDGSHLSLDVGAGYEFARGGLVLEPVVRLSYVDVEIDGFRERARHGGAGAGWAAAVDDQDVESLTLSLGFRASYIISQSWAIIQPQLNIDWLHEFKDDSRLLTGRFAEAANTPANRFELSSEEPDANYFRLGLGASLLFPNGATGFIQYSTILGYDNLSDHTVNAGLRWEF